MPHHSSTNGIDTFIEYVGRVAGRAPAGWNGTAWFVLQIGEDCANIRTADFWNPLTFWRQMASAPPLRFGTDGFDPRLVDDANPARHYTAFVFVGFWLPQLPGLMLLVMWEIAGFFRYGGIWSQKDLACGLVGLRHGHAVRRFGPTVLPAFIAAELADTRFPPKSST